MKPSLMLALTELFVAAETAAEVRTFTLSQLVLCVVVVLGRLFDGVDLM